MLYPGVTDRFVNLGPTGCGKSKLADHLLAYVWALDRRVTNLIVDFKREWKGAPIAKSLRHLERELDRAAGNGDERVIYRPPVEDLLKQNASRLDQIAAIARDRHFTRVYYDELYFVANGSDFQERAPNYFYAVTTGRKDYVPICGSVQRPAWIPKIALSESDLRSVFFLRMRNDRATAEELCGETVPWNVLKRERYSFVQATDSIESGPSRIALNGGQHGRRHGSASAGADLPHRRSA